MLITPQHFLDGQMLLINKPLGWTSFDVVNKIRFALRGFTSNKKIKVGHAGTLDPLATGLLIVCTGKFTKRIDEFQGMPKSYRATIKLGAKTPSYDAETEESETYDISGLSIVEVENAMKEFVGQIEQFPPMYSAIKKDGIKLYELARKGEAVDLVARQVEVTKFDLIENRWPEIVVHIDCSKGTYIRSMAHDLGKALGIGAYLTALERTAIGEFEVSQALTLNAFLDSLKTN